MKKSHWINFSIDEHTKISIPLEDPIEYLGPAYQENILLFYNKHKIVLSDSTIYHDMMELAESLKKALDQELILHSSITKDIGYLYNEYHHDDTNFTTHTFPNGFIGWVGFLNHLWESLSHFNSWVYNAPDGSIIFEVTPLYPYNYCEPEKEPDYIPYEEWIKTYKPYFMTTLSKKTALEWLEQAEHIIKIVEENQKRWDRRPKEDVES